MLGRPKKPLDTRPYARSPNSRPLTIHEVPGSYVYVVDLDEVIHIDIDAPHQHPKVLGSARSALYAGTLIIEANCHVPELTNASGTFQFQNRKSLCCVAQKLRDLGFTVGSVVWYPPDGSRVRTLNCPGTV